MPLDPITSLKQIAELVKKYNDLELMKQIVDLQNQLFDSQREKLQLEKALADLKAQLDVRQKLHMRGPNNYFYMDGDDVPLCPLCWERDQKVIHLPPPDQYMIGLGRVCRVCKHDYSEDGGKPTPPIRGLPGRR
jgi:hypothetical protein